MDEEARVQEGARLQKERDARDAGPQNFQRLPEEMIPLDAQMQEIMGRLDKERIVGFAGMGGLGKTTLAMAIFNELGSRFEYTCFVRDVKLMSGGEDTVKDVVWNHLCYHGKKVEGQKNWSTLQGKTLLLVLDDISYREARVLFDLANGPAAESRFIVTSRDQQLLRNLGQLYAVPVWSSSGAKALVKKHAFPNQEKSPKDLKTVMASIIKKCDGLPLTLEVLGKYLQRKKRYEDWEQTLNALEDAEDVENLDQRLWAKLRVSYDDLRPKEKQIFLDATTFFGTGSWTLQKAQAAWRVACNTNCERLLWQTLVDTSLVYSVEEDETIKVHEQLRQLGQRIALEPSNNDRYRVWDGKEGLKMLQTINEWNGQSFHALRLGELDGFGNCPIHIPRAVLPKLKKVQFLEVNRPVIIDGAPEGVSVSTGVVVFRCSGQDLFSPAVQTHPVHLELVNLEDLPQSIGKLSGLKYLHIWRGNVQTLPSPFGQLKALQHLNLDCLGKLESLPDSFGQLSALNHLSVSCKNLQILPESFGQLSALNHLSFSKCYNLQILPESFGQLFALNHLKFTSCQKLQILPESFGQLSALNHLEFSSCQLQILPESFGQLSALNHLKFSFCKELQILNSLVARNCRPCLNPSDNCPP